MAKFSKSFSLCLVITLAIALSLMIIPAYALTVPKLSVPQFTLQPNGPSVQVTVKNQPVLLTIENAINVSIYYNIRAKEHTSDRWTELLTNDRLDLTSMMGNVATQYIGQNTIMYYPADSYSKGTELDIQVKAMYGKYWLQESASGSPLAPDSTELEILADGQSDWSPTQTFIIGQGSITPSANSPSKTPLVSITPVNASNMDSLLLIISISVIATIVLLAIIAFLLVYMRKRRPTEAPAHR